MEYLLWRETLDDGELTTVYAVHHFRPTGARVVHFPRPERLDVWARLTGRHEAIVGGFFVRDPYRPLGEAWIDGAPVQHERVPAPFDARRTCLVAHGEDIDLLARVDAPARPPGDLLQAGPLLVADGRVAFDPAADGEGFSAGSGQFDSDITDGRHPRAALGIAEDRLVAVACDGRRTGVDAGLSMLELARIMERLGTQRAMNLDGGGSATLVHHGHLLNRPYSSQDQPGPQSRRVVTALCFS